MISSDNQTTVSFYTLGCRLNQSETASIEQSFAKDGFRIVDFKQPADVVIINTCTVTENGDADTRRLVNKVNRINPAARIALIGCQAQVQKSKLTELPNVAWVVGNQRKMDIAEIVAQLPQPAEPTVIAPTITRDPFTIPTASIDSRHTRANIKIQDGCDFFCSFCEIPYARGRARSRVFDDILTEARALTAAGHQELVITGINVGTYQYQGYGFMDVIDALEQIDELKRIRISSIEPTTIPFALFERMSKTSKLCRHLHIPLQSGDDAVLAAMKRKYTTREFLDFIQHVEDTVDEVCIGTDVIVGFPGESETQFQATEDFLREAPVDYFHVFSYSRRYLAKSQDMAGEQTPPIIQERSRRLRELGQRKRRMFHESLVATDQLVLFEQLKNGRLTGITDNYVRVAVDETEALCNHFRAVNLQSIEGDVIFGKIK